MIDQVLASAEKLDPPTALDDDASAVDAPRRRRQGRRQDRRDAAREVKVKLSRSCARRS